MDRLSTFQENDPRRLFELAKKLHQKAFFKEVLNNTQYQILRHVIEADSFSLWREFLDGNCVLSIDWSDKTSTEGEDENESIEEGNKPIKALALNMRFLLWEKAIDFYYASSVKNVVHSRMYNIEHSSEDYKLIEQLDDLPREKVIERTVEPEEPKKTSREEDDDYDDDEDDDDDDNIKEEVKERETQQIVDTEMIGPENFTKSEQGQIILRLPSKLLQGKNGENPQTDGFQTQMSGDDMTQATISLQDRDLQIKNFNKIYHNFEYDRETLIKRRKLEKSDMQIENQKNSDNPDIQISFGAASHSLKHLLNTIRDKRDNISLSDLELRGLFLDIRKNRGKWANDDRVGQEELYEACEKVLLDLRGYTEHSTPFLNKVSKREAPNYGLIIKTPMDLNTVLKKLKLLSYNSKAEFVDDLMLIWNNCLLYNADPKHFLRAHALEMQRRTQKLISSIPDISIKSRSELEKDEDGENESSVAPTSKGGKTSKKGQMRRREEVIKSEETDSLADPVNTVSEGVSPALSAPVGPENGSVDQNEDNPDDEDDDADEGDPEERDEDNDDIQDTELQAWKVFTAKSRANYCANRAALFEKDYKLKMDAEAIIRESKKMCDFNHFLDNKEVVSKGNKLLDNDDPYLLEYDIAGGIPEIAYPGIDDKIQEKYENLMVEKLIAAGTDENNMPSGLVPSATTGLNKAYIKNITEIQEIRKICFKISLIRQMQTQQFMHRTQMRQPEIEYLKELDIDPVAKLPNHDINNPNVQYAALRKSIAKIAMHTGFETAGSFAVNTLTQVAERYMSNLAKSMKLHRESSSRNQVGASESILLCLLENGVDKPDDLYTFIEEKIRKTEKKLVDLRGKLSGFLKDLLRPSLEKFSEQNFDDNSEQFTTGDFTSELGDDFFGFKELGLDKEFKMLSSSVPAYLLHARLHNSFNNNGPTSKTSKYEDLRDWKSFKLRKEDVSKQIGLLQTFYNDLADRTTVFYAKQNRKKSDHNEMAKNQIMYLLEDDDLPQKQRNIRPRLPPNGRIQSIKKKPLSSIFILPEEDLEPMKEDPMKEDPMKEDPLKEEPLFGMDDNFGNLEQVV